MKHIGRSVLVLIAFVALVACGPRPPSGAEHPPEVDLGSVAFPESGLPDPCEILRAARVDELLVRPLDEHPTLAPGFCMMEVARGERFELQTSAALELTAREQPMPTNMEEYLLLDGEGVHIAGSKPDDVTQLEGLGDFSIWFPHKYPPETTTITLSSFFGDGYFLSIEVHRVDREVAFAWARDVAAQVIERVAPATRG